MRKVNLTVIRPWIVNKVVELVGFEDEVVVEYAMGLLEDDSQPVSPYVPEYMRSFRSPFVSRHQIQGRCRLTSQVS